ncbi:recombination regulator RecX [Corynebacterium senegalense]|uniref:recombination regulator RecX n=1 Tax=Corynebacterium senegalense TaxID=2080750 RepID=UPI000E20B8FF|nr:recombination regulator RecX [Corynebacterium senegalense]
MAAPDPEKLQRLQAALDAYEAGEAGGALFDRAAEEALAPVRKRALGLLDQRARSRQELRERLLRAEFEDALVDRVLDDLERTGLLDDAAFAREWVRQRAARRGKSAKALDLELQAKGVGAPQRAEALEQISAEDEEATARAVAEKKARGVKAPPADRAEYDAHLRRIVGVMARRGYVGGMSMRLGREVLDQRIEELGGD